MHLFTTFFFQKDFRLLSKNHTQKDNLHHMDAEHTGFATLCNSYGVLPTKIREKMKGEEKT